MKLLSISKLISWMAVMQSVEVVNAASLKGAGAKTPTSSTTFNRRALQSVQVPGYRECTICTYYLFLFACLLEF